MSQLFAHDSRFLEEMFPQNKASEEAHLIRKVDEAMGRMLSQLVGTYFSQHSPTTPAAMTALSYTEPIIAAVLFLLAATFMTQMSPVPQLDVPGSLNNLSILSPT